MGRVEGNNPLASALSSVFIQLPRMRIHNILFSCSFIVQFISVCVCFKVIRDPLLARTFTPEAKEASVQGGTKVAVRDKEPAPETVDQVTYLNPVNYPEAERQTWVVYSTE
jgi:hypothetical protein